MKVLVSWMLFVNICFANGFFETHSKGWHWYEKMEKDEDPKSDKKKEDSKPKTPSDIVKAYSKELENRLHKAWMNPTGDNIKGYMEMQKDMVDRSETFSQNWMKTIFTNPRLDETLKNPVNQKARHLQLDLQKKKTKETIKDLSKEYDIYVLSCCRLCVN